MNIKISFSFCPKNRVIIMINIKSTLQSLRCYVLGTFFLWPFTARYLLFLTTRKYSSSCPCPSYLRFSSLHEELNS